LPGLPSRIAYERHPKADDYTAFRHSVSLDCQTACVMIDDFVNMWCTRQGIPRQQTTHIVRLTINSSFDGKTLQGYDCTPSAAEGGKRRIERRQPVNCILDVHTIREVDPKAHCSITSVVDLTTDCVVKTTRPEVVHVRHMNRANYGRHIRHVRFRVDVPSCKMSQEGSFVQRQCDNK
jgi:hypothetical protein